MRAKTIARFKLAHAPRRTACAALPQRDPRRAALTALPTLAIPSRFAHLLPHPLQMKTPNVALGERALYAGPVDCFRQIVRNEGVAGLYRGLRPNLIGVMPEKSLKLTVNDVCREAFTESNGPAGGIRLHQEMISGATAGFVQVAATNPMEIVKLRLQLQGEAGGVKKSAMAVIQELGPRGLYKGIAACWLRDVPFSIVFFPLFANLKKAFDGNNSMLGLFCAGALAGSSAAGVVTPCDVVKTRLQVAGSTYKGVGDAFSRILREEGAAALFKGVQPRMLVQAPLFGITLGAFDVQKRWYADQMAKASRVA